MYSVKVILECCLNGEPDGTYEEMILLVDAVSETEAGQKALEYSKKYSEAYIGAEGDRVTWEYVGMYDPMEIDFLEENGVREIFFCRFDREDNDLNNILK